MKHKQFYALKASLPMLLFDGGTLITFQRFFECCEVFLPEKGLEFLRSLTLCPLAEKGFPGASTMDAYARWEITLRNTLARLRAAKLTLDAEPYLVSLPGEEDLSASAVAKQVFSMQADPLEKERFLDRARWEYLESMEMEHTFDFDSLCLYYCKMLIRNKYVSRQKEQAVANLDRAALLSEKASENVTIS